MKGSSNKLAKLLCEKPGKECVWLLKRKERKGKGEESEATEASSPCFHVSSMKCTNI